MRELPKIVRDYWYSIDWDVEAIWALDLPVETRSLASLDWHLDVPIWPGPDGDYTVSARQVLRHPERHASEAGRIDAADLAYPIDVHFNRDRWMILDGFHRLARAFREGQETVRVRVVPSEHVEQLTLAPD